MSNYIASNNNTSVYEDATVCDDLRPSANCCLAPVQDVADWGDGASQAAAVVSIVSRESWECINVATCLSVNLEPASGRPSAHGAVSSLVCQWRIRPLQHSAVLNGTQANAALDPAGLGDGLSQLRFDDGLGEVLPEGEDASGAPTEQAELPPWACS
jgi:hypothetical protein